MNRPVCDAGFAFEHEDPGGEDVEYSVAMPGDDGSVMLAGRTSVDWSGTNAGEYDFAAVKVDGDGQEIWRWKASLSKHPKEESSGV